MIQPFSIGRELLEPCDTSRIEGITSELEGDPELVRRMGGRFVLEFSDNSHEQVIWLNPAIRAWGRQLYQRIPHFLYYTLPDPRAQALALLASGFLDPAFFAKSVSDQAQSDAEADELLLPIYAEHMVAAALFAERMADDWRRFADPYVAQMRPNLGRSVVSTVEASLALSGAAARREA